MSRPFGRPQGLCLGRSADCRKDRHFRQIDRSVSLDRHRDDALCDPLPDMKEVGLAGLRNAVHHSPLKTRVWRLPGSRPGKCSGGNVLEIGAMTTNFPVPSVLSPTPLLSFDRATHWCPRCGDAAMGFEDSRNRLRVCHSTVPVADLLLNFRPVATGAGCWFTCSARVEQTPGARNSHHIQRDGRLRWSGAGRNPRGSGRGGPNGALRWCSR